MLFLYLDESGTYVFSKNGSEYLIFTALATNNPYALQHRLCELEKKLRKDNKLASDSEYFHATEDKQIVRDEVFDVLKSSDDFTIDSIIVEKCKTNPTLYEPTRLYKKIYHYLLNYVFQRHQEVEKILIFVDAPPVRNKRHAFEKGVLPTSSMVSFALAQLVRIGGDESLFSHWPSPKKADVLVRGNDAALIEYVEFCATQLSIFLGAAKANLPAVAWAIKKKEGAGILATVSVNGLIILFRKVVKPDGLSDFEGYKAKLKKLSDFDFHGYHSSHYNRMANEMVATIYGK